MKREYDGPELDLSWQHFSERPEGATSEEEQGSVTVEGVDKALIDIREESLMEDIDEWIEQIRDWDFDWRQDLLLSDGLPNLVRCCIAASIIADQHEYNARIDADRWARAVMNFDINYMRLFDGGSVFAGREYVGDPSLHDEYERILFDEIPTQYPGPTSDSGSQSR